MRKDKERLQVLNEDLSKFAPSSYKPEHLNESVLDGSFLDIKERNVVEILDMKVR